MSPAYGLYNLIVSLAGPVILGAAAAKGRLGGRWLERLGFYSRIDGGPPRIWVHAVSVGEVQVAAAVIQALAKRCPEGLIWLTTTTETGRRAAREALGPGFPLFPFPLDAYGGPRRAIRRLKPDLIVILETELWPNFLREAHRAGVRTMLANGRISPRSYKNYQKVRFLFGEVLGYLDRLAMIRTGDADRVIGLGADPGRTLVAGNAKYDLLMAKADPDRAARLAVRLGPLGPGPVWVAGSTREGEEKIIMDVFSTLRAEFPGLHLILAPRHVGRSDRIESRIAGAGWRVRRWSRPDAGGGSDVTLVDAMGDLFHLYARADAAFIGGSLVPLGGQNPLEPAVWGRPMLFGPHMEDFEDAVALLDSHGAGRKVQDGADLARTLADLFRRPDQARDLGQRGKQALAGHRGAADRLAEQALDLIGAAAGAGHEREPVL